MRLTGRDFVLHVAQRARAGERTCWRIEEECCRSLEVFTVLAEECCRSLEVFTVLAV